MNPEPLFRLIYLSHATKEFSSEELQELLRGSRERNDLSHITGLLIYLRDNFLQVLEGPRAEVERLYQNLLTDSRHEQLEILIQGQVNERLFSEWSMAFSQINADELEALAGFRSLSKLYLKDKNLREREVSDLIRIFIKTYSL